MSVPEPVASTRPHLALTRLATRQLRRSTVIVIVLAAGMSALVASQYESLFSGINAQGLMALAANPAIRTLFGTPVALDDPGGFTVWRTGTPIGVIVGVWALLSATRLTRGEEDAGRWDLLLVGRVRAVALVAHALGVLATAAVLVGAGTGVGLVLTGTQPTGAVLHGVGIAGIGLSFAALGLLTAQILPTRGGASGMAAALLGATLLARMLADGVDRLEWMHWFSPFGLVAEVQPYAANRPSPVVVLLAIPVVLCGAALLAAQRRDVGTGLFRPRTRRRPRTGLLRSLPGFAIRRGSRPFLGWVLGIGAYYFLIGTLTVSINEFLSSNDRFAKLAASAGFEMNSTSGFAAVMYGLLAVPTGLYAATRIAALADAEANRRLVALFSQPLSRSRILGVDTVVAVVGVLLLLVIAGLLMWSGSTLVGAEVAVGDMLAGALNVAPVALLSLGAAVLALGWFRDAVFAVGALPTAGGFLFDALVQSVDAPEWMEKISPFAHLASVPATTVDWTATVAMVVVAVLLAALGVTGYARRDLTC